MKDEAIEELRFRLDFPCHPSVVGVARHLVRGMHRWFDEESLDRCELIVSELVTNAIRHGCMAGSFISMELTVSSGRLEGCVSDHGEPFSAPRAEPQRDQIGGYGLHIVDRLAQGWSIEHTGHGNAVRFAVLSGTAPQEQSRKESGSGSFPLM